MEQKDVVRKKQNIDSIGQTGIETQPQLLYDLCATIDHSGTLHHGHYVSNVKVENQWYNCNDSFITLSNENAVLQNKEVYMMFYILS